MEHHASCSPSDRSLIWKCTQCGLEEPATQHTEADSDLYEEMDLWRTRATRAETELLRTQEELLRCIDSKPRLIARINELEAQPKKD